jgi:hypothetical protein
MISLFAALSLAIAEPSRADLTQCLAYLSTAPEYAGLDDAGIARSDQFFVDAKNRYCADEVSELWDLAHHRARLSLGLPSEGQMADGQQEAAERELASMLRGTWQSARTYRAHPRPLSGDRMQRMIATWLLDDRNTAALDKIMVKPLACLAKGAAEGKAAIENTGLKPSRSLAESCGYDGAVQEISGMIGKRFAAAQPEFINRAAAGFVQQAILWASLGERNGSQEPGQ